MRTSLHVSLYASLHIDNSRVSSSFLSFSYLNHPRLLPVPRRHQNPQCAQPALTSFTFIHVLLKLSTYRNYQYAHHCRDCCPSEAAGATGHINRTMNIKRCRPLLRLRLCSLLPPRLLFLTICTMLLVSFSVMLACLSTFSTSTFYQNHRHSYPSHRNEQDSISPLPQLCSHVHPQKLVSFEPPQTSVSKSSFQQVIWDTIVSNHIYSSSLSDVAFSLIHDYGQSLLEDITQLSKLAVIYNPYLRTFSSPSSFSSSVPIRLVYAHRRLGRISGLQYAANFIYNSSVPSSSSIHSHSFTLFLRKSLSAPTRCTLAISSRKVEETITPIYILVPYHRRPKRLRSFLSHFSSLLQQSHVENNLAILENSIILITILPTCHSEVSHIISSFSPSLVNIINIIQMKQHLNFSRAIALRTAASTLPFHKSPAILLQCDIDIHLSLSFLTRCRNNVIPTRQAYFPIFYSLYSHSSSLAISLNYQRQQTTPPGFWRTSSYGVVCISKGDFDDVDPFVDANVRFKHWGGEDIYQYDRVRDSGMIGLRAVDPGVVHEWHYKSCVPTSQFYVSCVKTNLLTLGHPLRLAAALLSQSKNVRDSVALLSDLEKY